MLAVQGMVMLLYSINDPAVIPTNIVMKGTKYAILRRAKSGVVHTVQTAFLIDTWFCFLAAMIDLWIFFTFSLAF